jgi:hypothetical protein
MTTTTHPFTPEEVMAFVDGELSADRAESLSVHVDQCIECSNLLTHLRGLSRQMTTWQVGPVPERLAGRVSRAAAEKRTKAHPLPGGAVKPRRPRALRLAVEIASGLAVVLLLLAIAVPNLLRSRMAANEASAVGALRVLNTAAVTYHGSYGHFPPSLKNFGPSLSGAPTEDGADLIDPRLAAGRRSGYRFTYRTVPGVGRDSGEGYTIYADPVEPGKGGQRHFSTDQSGTLFADGVAFGSSPLPEKATEHERSRSAEEQTAGHRADAAPMIARTADLKLLVEKLDDARQAMDRILREHQGYVAQLSASAESGSARIVVASLRVPADQLDLCLAELKKLGRVTQESQAGEEVTQLHLDLVARLKNSRNTEQRLNEVLQKHAGKVKDVLDVEKESARVRGEIEQMESEQQTLEHRVNFATIDLKLAEEYQAQLSPPAPSVGMQLRNATVNGFRNARESLLDILLFFAESGPTLLLWLLILLFPARLIWKRYKRQLAMS